MYIIIITLLWINSYPQYLPVFELFPIELFDFNWGLVGLFGLQKVQGRNSGMRPNTLHHHLWLYVLVCNQLCMPQWSPMQGTNTQAFFCRDQTGSRDTAWNLGHSFLSFMKPESLCHLARSHPEKGQRMSKSTWEPANFRWGDRAPEGLFQYCQCTWFTVN